MAKKADSNQKDIVDALRRMGCFVFSLHEVGKGCPDLLVSHPRTRHAHLIEIKNGKLGWKLTDSQKKFRALCHASVVTLTSTVDAVTWFKNVPQRTMVDVMDELDRYE